MSGLERRSLLAALFAAVPGSMLAGRVAAQPTVLSPSPVRSGSDRFGATRPIPTGTSVFKVATVDTAGSLFVMEHSNLRPGTPRHLHYGEDELFYVIEGD
jgi:hypothetical protein